MIELRWFEHSDMPIVGGGFAVGLTVLQYRVNIPCVDASGALCPGNGWSEWTDVPSVKGK